MWYPCAQDVDCELVLLAFPEILDLANSSFPWTINQLCKSGVLPVQHILVVYPCTHSLCGIVQYIKESRCCCFLPHFSAKVTDAWNYYSNFFFVCLFSLREQPVDIGKFLPGVLQGPRGLCLVYFPQQGTVTFLRNASMQYLDIVKPYNCCCICEGWDKHI